MSDELTMVAMLAITAGAALIVAWPLMFGSARPEDYLESQPKAEVSQSEPLPGPLQSRGASGPRADLDVEWEIEAFRRQSKQTDRQDRIGGQ